MALLYCVFKQKITNAGTQYEFSWSKIFLVRWSLDSPSHLEYTDSCSSYQLCDLGSIVERANYDAQSRHIPLREGLNLQALWCSMLPMVSSALYLFCSASLLSRFSSPLGVHCSLYLWSHGLFSVSSFSFWLSLCSWI